MLVMVTWGAFVFTLPCKPVEVDLPVLVDSVNVAARTTPLVLVDTRE